MEIGKFPLPNKLTATQYSLRPVEANSAATAFANESLWPLLHSFASMFEFRRSLWTEFCRANERIAREIEAEVERLVAESPGRPVAVWVHDYQLALVMWFLFLVEPAERPLVRLRHLVKVGVFIHTTWPSADMFRHLPLPHARALLASLASADVVGMQSARDVAHFRECCESVGMALGGNPLRVLANPVAVDVPRWQFLCAEQAVLNEAAALRRTADLVIVSVDREDFSKGILLRLRAFDVFLEQNPGIRASLLQVAVPTRGSSRIYGDLREQTSRLSVEINAKHTTPVGGAPVRLMRRMFTPRQLAVMYRGAHVVWVSSIRDGHNLVAAESVASFDPADPGVLLCSPFAGVADSGAVPGAMLVSPFDLEGGADALATVAAMSLGERRNRHEESLQALAKRSPAAWAGSFLSSLQHA